jgi:hypothetical protein
MPAYVKELTRPLCCCGKLATVGVYNKYNALVGYFCRRCGGKKVKELDSGV